MLMTVMKICHTRDFLIPVVFIKPVELCIRKEPVTDFNLQCYGLLFFRRVDPFFVDWPIF